VNVSDDGIFYIWNELLIQGGETSERWTHHIIDLSDYIGENISIRFQYVTDLFDTTPDSFGGGWWLDDIKVFDAASTQVFFDDMEGTPSFHSPDWEYGTPGTGGPTSAQSGTNVWGTILNGNYNDYTRYELYSDYIDIRSAEVGAELSFSHWLDVPPGSADGGNVWIQSRTGKMEQIDPTNDDGNYDNWIQGVNILGGQRGFTMDTSGWENVTFTIPDEYIGLDEVRFIFKFGTDTDTQAGGWFIDDVSVDVINEGMSTSTIVQLPYVGDAETDMDGWLGGWWDRTGPAVKIMDNHVTYMDDEGVEIFACGGIIFTGNNVSYGEDAVYIANGQGLEVRSEGDSYTLEVNIDITDNEISNNDNSGVYIEMEYYDLYLTVDENTFKHNEGTVFELDLYSYDDGNLYLESFSDNVFGQNWYSSGSPRRGDDSRRVINGNGYLYSSTQVDIEVYENDRRSQMGTAVSSIFTGPIDNNEFIEGGDAFYMYADGWIIMESFSNNVIQDNYHISSGNLYGDDGVYLEADDGAVSCTDFSYNTITGGGDAVYIYSYAGGADDYATSDLRIFENNISDNRDDTPNTRSYDDGNYGIYIDGSRTRSDIRIYDNILSGNAFGIHMEQSGWRPLYSQIYDNIIDSNWDYGVYVNVKGSGDFISNIHNNDITNNGEYYGCGWGMFLDVMHEDWWGGNPYADVDVDSNDISGNDGTGFISFMRYRPGDYSYTDNTINDNGDCNGYGAWLINTENAMVSGNTMDSNYDSNLYLMWSDGVYVYQNDLTNSDNSRGLYNDRSSNTHIWDNDINDNSDDGIYVNPSDYLTIEDNEISNNGGNGIYLYYSDHNTINDNTIFGNGEDGIYYYRCRNGDVFSNTIYNNTEDGVNATGWTGTTNWNISLYLNIISYNGGDGIRIQNPYYSMGRSFSGHTQVYENTLLGNGGTGLYLYTSLASSAYPDIRQNNIQDNVDWAIYNSNPDYIVFDLVIEGTGYIKNSPIYIGYGNYEVLNGGTITFNNVNNIYMDTSQPVVSKILVYTGGSLLIYDSIVTSNWAWYGTTVEYFDFSVYGSVTLGDSTVIYSNGVVGSNAQLVSITRCTVTQTNGHGIHLTNCNSITIDDSFIKHNSGDGIRLQGTATTIQGNSIFNNTFGIKGLYSSPDILENSIYSNRNDGIRLTEADGALIDGNHIYGNAGSQVGLFNSRSVTISDNLINTTHSYSAAQALGDQEGVFLSSSGNMTSPITLHDNTIKFNSDGIEATNGSYIVVYDEFVSYNVDGIMILDNSDADVDDSTVAGNNLLDFYLTDNSFALVTNTTHDKSKVTVQNTGAGMNTKIIVEW